MRVAYEDWQGNFHCSSSLDIVRPCSLMVLGGFVRGLLCGENALAGLQFEVRQIEANGGSCLGPCSWKVIDRSEQMACEM